MPIPHSLWELNLPFGVSPHISLVLGFLSWGLVAICGVLAVGKLGLTVLLCHPPAWHGITRAVGAAEVSIYSAALRL